MWQLVVSLALLCSGSEALSCMDEANNPVDWYILYKLPNSFDYAYIDSGGQRPNTKPINDQNGILANTLAPYLDRTPGVAYIAYNDATKPGQNYGHSKGFVMTDQNRGFWLLHSTPHFPYCRQRDDFFPDSGETNGQTFICVTLQYDTFKKIGIHLQYIHAPVFKHNVPQIYFKELQDAANGVSRDPNTLTTLGWDLMSVGNQRFRAFMSKTSPNVAVGDLYVTIAEDIRSDVSAQTWGCQRDRDNNPYVSPTTRVTVNNVKSVSVGGMGPWPPTKDHSKWCVSLVKKKPWTCIADSNRAPTQYNRPGGALCIYNPTVQSLFRGFIKGFIRAGGSESSDPAVDCDST